ncbi:hypothetical protein BDZ97DRAFT_1923678 [Flammula alnicola]|nr:hypothetical protein BDZ97DRAFT_1923678 [Flammula alnicola]
MPDYVYALHDFLPEHEDEVDFRAGERIEVVEKDDLYGDGWWQGRNLAGKVGLFPMSYTAPAPPAATSVEQSSSSSTTTEEPAAALATTKSVLQPLHEVSEAEAERPHIASPVPKQPPATFLNGDGYESDTGHGKTDDESLHLASVPDGEVMKATMTDVQKAIEQLGRGGGGEDRDGARSFSFASTQDGADTDTDYDLSDVDGTGNALNGDDWHKNAREKLAAKARRAVEEAEKLEAMMSSNDTSSIRRSVAPPIEVELSDESEAEDEGDFTRSSKFQRAHPYILEEDETEEVEVEPTHVKEPSAAETEKQGPSTTAADTQIDMPPRDESEVPTATATKLSFPVFSPPAPAVESAPEKPADRPTSLTTSSYPPPTTPPRASTPPESKRSSAPVREIPSMNGLPSPSASHFSNTFQSKHNSIVSSASAPAMTISAPQAPQAPSEQATSPQSEMKKKHPTEWSVEEVVEWLKSRGFDQDVCDKFTEQEITGDVLLELDVNLLKSEIGIMAFGKRMRIANAITDLRRPPSIEYSDHHISSSGQPSPMQLQHNPSTHSRTLSTSQSHHSYPGSTVAAAVHSGGYYPQSGQGSSPQAYHGQGYGYGNQFGSVQETPSQDQQHVEPGVVAAVAAASGVGLGIALASTSPSSDAKTRPAQLLLSPNSDGALKESAAKSNFAIPVNEDDDRGHMSDGDIAPATTSVRRRLFGRSQDSSLSVINSSRPSPIPSPTTRGTPDKELKDKDSVKESLKGSAKGSAKEGKDKEKQKEGRDSSTVGGRHARARKSVDGGKHGDRLSIFGGTFAGTLGKSRKPPPSAGDEPPVERTSKFILPRLHSTSLRKSSTTSQRPSTPSGSPKDTLVGSMQESSDKDKEAEKENLKKDHATLRKRTVSTPASTTSPTATQEMVNGLSGPIKQGHNILEQIGEPDHAGWMRKKGDRYNTWKLRYFVLKGPHLYCLKSNSKTETRIKGYIHIIGYRVTVDENIDPGRYGFRIDHDHDKTYYFSSEEKTVIRDWMKAIMKATIGRDYTKPVVSSCNIPTIPLVVAQAMNPAPRPPSPTARDATQKALRRENPDQLSSRDARVLMGLPDNDAKDERAHLDSFFSNEAVQTNGVNGNPPLSPKRTSAPPRPSREMRRTTSQRNTINSVADDALIEWANTHLPEDLQITDPHGSLCGGLALLRLAESIRGRPSSPPVPDSAFPVDPSDDKLDGLFRLFDFLLDNDVKMGSVSINDVRQGKREKILQLLRALKAWEDKRRVLANTIAKGSMQPGSAFMVPVVM